MDVSDGDPYFEAVVKSNKNNILSSTLQNKL